MSINNLPDIPGPVWGYYNQPPSSVFTAYLTVYPEMQLKGLATL